MALTAFFLGVSSFFQAAWEVVLLAVQSLTVLFPKELFLVPFLAIEAWAALLFRFFVVAFLVWVTWLVLPVPFLALKLLSWQVEILGVEGLSFLDGKASLLVVWVAFLV